MSSGRGEERSGTDSRGAALRIGILVVSDRAATGEREDRSGPALEEGARQLGWEVIRRAVVPDGTAAIVPPLLEWCDRGDLDLLLVTGGTGVAPRDRTPEAVLAVVDRLLPGIMERFRRVSESRSPGAALSRGMAGLRGATAVVALPGSPSGALDGLELLAPIAGHMAALLRGEDAPHPPRANG